MIGDPDFGDLDGLVDGADIPFDRRVEVIGVGADLARFQRAGKGAGQSTRHRRDHVVERRRVFAFGRESVEFGYAPVDAIVERLLEILDEGPAKRRLVLHDLDVACMNGVGHGKFLPLVLRFCIQTLAIVTPRSITHGLAAAKPRLDRPVRQPRARLWRMWYYARQTEKAGTYAIFNTCHA